MFLQWGELCNGECNSRVHTIYEWLLQQWDAGLKILETFFLCPIKNWTKVSYITWRKHYQKGLMCRCSTSTWNNLPELLKMMLLGNLFYLWHYVGKMCRENLNTRHNWYQDHWHQSGILMVSYPGLVTMSWRPHYCLRFWSFKSLIVKSWPNKIVQYSGYDGHLNIGLEKVWYLEESILGIWYMDPLCISQVLTHLGWLKIFL